MFFIRGILLLNLYQEKRLIRRRSRAMSNAFCKKKIARDHDIKVPGAPRYALFHYKLFGILPIVTKRINNTGRVRWYLLGLFILQMKQASPSQKRNS